MTGIFRSRVFNKVIYKFSLIFSAIYFMLFYQESLSMHSYFQLAISVITAMGIAGIGYIINDLKDYEKDLLTSKRNLFIGKSNLFKFGIIVLCCCFALIPWFYLPFTLYSFLLLCLEIILYLVYAVPPFRLKEKGFSGILCDALYAQVIPCVLAIYTFYLAGQKKDISVILIFIYTAWLLITGIRNIIYHQIQDYDNDIKSNTTTFVTKLGLEKSKRITYPYLFILEFSLFILLLILINFSYQLLLILFIFYLLFILLFRYKSIQQKSNQSQVYVFVNEKVLNEFYEIHMPVIMLVYFSFLNKSFIILLLAHLILFSVIYYDYTKGFYNKYIN